MTTVGFSVVRNAHVSSWLNFGSFAPTHRKNRSR